MPDTTHLVALVCGLHSERRRLASSRTEAERKLRSIWIAQREREIAAERAFLGLRGRFLQGPCAGARNWPNHRLRRPGER
jgi:hypothetical protein